MAKAKQAETQISADGTFPRAKKREMGYKTTQVDEFLARARTAYDSQIGGAQDGVAYLTAADIRATAFSLQRKGYSARFVDAAMDRLEEVFFERERQQKISQHGEDAWWQETGALLSEVRGRLMRAKGKRFKRRGIFASGYKRSQVDAFLNRISAMLAGEEKLSISEVRSVVFHMQWRGYSEDEVDSFLDGVVQLLLATR